MLGALLTSSPNKVQGRSWFRSPVSQPPAALACVLLGPVTSLGNQGVLFTGRRGCQLQPQVDNPRSGQTTRCGRAAAVISPLCSGVKVPVRLNSVLAVDPIDEDISIGCGLRMFSRCSDPCFPFSTTMRSLPPVPEGQTRTDNRKLLQNGCHWCQKVTTNWWQKGAKGQRAKEGVLGGTLVVGQVR